MIAMLAAALAFGATQDIAAPSVSPQSPIEIANATQFDLEFSGRRVVGCTITATSGHPQVDRYICVAARSCGDDFSNTDRRAACVAKKRQELAEQIAKSSAREND